MPNRRCPASHRPEATISTANEADHLVIRRGRYRIIPEPSAICRRSRCARSFLSPGSLPRVICNRSTFGASPMLFRKLPTSV
jgi:hypothetical protein